MKKCPNCQTENLDTSRFCNECGTRLPDSENKTETKSMEAWYYVEDGASKGPFSKDDFLNRIVSGDLGPDTYVWTRGMKEWTRLKSTPLYQESEPAEMPAEPETAAASSTNAFTDTSTPQSTQTSMSGSYSSTTETYGDSSQAQEWYYAVNGRSYGPFSETVMIGYIRQGILDGESLVWKSNFEDWRNLSATELRAYLPAQSTAPRRSQPDLRSNAGNSSTAYITPRNPVLYLLGSILTCGIFSIVWLYLLVEDSNRLAAAKGQPQGPSAMSVILLTIVTCGLYLIYYFYKLGNLLYDCSGRRQSNNAVLMLILSIFGLDVVSMMIAQDQINTIVSQD